MTFKKIALVGRVLERRDIFYTLTEAMVLDEQWRRLYNTVRPHSSLADQVPAHFGGRGHFIPGPKRLGFSQT